MEAEIEQLVSMGFSNDLASQALAETGGNLLRATDWLLQTRNSPSCNSNSSPPNVQPKINRFFHFQSKKDDSTPKPQSEYQKIEEDESAQLLIPRNKRQRLSEHEENILKTSPEKAASLPPPHAPLSERMRPRVLEEVVGQDHLLARESLLRSAIDCGRLPSVILWGPPGTGKTSIAKAIVSSCGACSSSFYRFVSLSAVTCGVKDVRDVVDEARKLKLKSNKRTVLFLDEVHRFNKAQQDSFLPVIEDGSIVFIGATTENPSFHLITPLLSRCRVLKLNPLKPHHLVMLLKRAVCDNDRGLAASLKQVVRIEAKDEAIEFLSLHCDGDARVALNALEVSATTAAARIEESDLDSKLLVIVTINDVKEALQCKHLAYDRAGEEHYNLISALHKSMRGSDADASIYWLARMLEGGEEPLYISRRLIRFASEDVGLADPQALMQAVACYQACHFVGMPECNVILAQCVAYLALAPKSVSVYRAIEVAQKVVKESVGQNEGVPLHLRNAPTKLMKNLGYGNVYLTSDNSGTSLVSDFWIDNAWNIQKLHALLPSNVVNVILNTSFSLTNDSKALWKPSENGEFSIKSLKAKRVSCISSLFSHIWNPNLLPSISFFFWRLMYGWLPVDDVMRKKRSHIVSKCHCCAAYEDIWHVFWTGYKAQAIWRTVFCWFNLTIPQLSSLKSLFLFWISSSKFVSSGHARILTPIITCWCIWLARNDSKHNNSPFVVNNIVWKIRNTLRQIGICGQFSSTHWLGDFPVFQKLGIFIKHKRLVWKSSMITWCKPSDPWIKLNCDGCAKGRPSIAAAGGIFRDSQGSHILSFTQFIGDGSSLLAELIGVKRGLEISLERGWNHLWIELDALIVIQIIKKGKGTWQVQMIVEQILNYMSNINCLLSHIHIEGNKAADWMANYSWNNNDTATYDTLLPPCNSLIHLDKLGLPNFRFKCT